MTTRVYKFMKMFISFKEYETEKGTLVLDSLEVGAEAAFIDENGELVPASDGQYVLEGNLVTITDGKIESVEEIAPAATEEPVEEPAEEPSQEEPSEEITEEQPEEEIEPSTEEEPVSNPELEEAKRVIEEQQARIAELEARIAELEAELNKPIEEPVEMKSVPQNTPKNINGVLKYFE